MLPQVAQTSALTYAPASRAEDPAGGLLQTLRRLQADELSPQGDGGVEKRSLIGALSAYLAMRPATINSSGGIWRHNVPLPWTVPMVVAGPPAREKRPSPLEDPKDLPYMGGGKSASSAASGLSVCLPAPARGPPSTAALACVGVRPRHGPSPGTAEARRCVRGGLLLSRAAGCVRATWAHTGGPGGTGGWLGGCRWSSSFLSSFRFMTLLMQMMKWVGERGQIWPLKLC